MRCSLLDLKMNTQLFRLRPAALWEMQAEILQVVVWTHVWLRANVDDLKLKKCNGLTRSNIGTLACERKRKHKYVLEKESAEVWCLWLNAKLQQLQPRPSDVDSSMFEKKKKTALFESTSQWCINDLIYVLFSCHESAGAENEASHYVLHMCGLEESGYPVQKTLLDHWKTDLCRNKGTE